MTHPAPADPYDTLIAGYVELLSNAAGTPGRQSGFDPGEYNYLARYCRPSTVEALAALLVNLRERAERQPHTVANLPVVAYVATHMIDGQPCGVALTEHTRRDETVWNLHTVHRHPEGNWSGGFGRYGISDWARAIDLMVERSKELRA